MKRFIRITGGSFQWNLFSVVCIPSRICLWLHHPDSQWVMNLLWLITLQMQLIVLNANGAFFSLSGQVPSTCSWAKSPEEPWPIDVLSTNKKKHSKEVRIWKTNLETLLYFVRQQTSFWTFLVRNMVFGTRQNFLLGHFYSSWQEQTWGFCCPTVYTDMPQQA